MSSDIHLQRSQRSRSENEYDYEHELRLVIEEEDDTFILPSLRIGWLEAYRRFAVAEVL